MFGDNTDQTNTGATTDNVVNPAVPSASDAAAMGTAATPPSAPDMSFPAVPSADPTITDTATDASAPATTDSTTSTPAVDEPTAEPASAPDESAPADLEVSPESTPETSDDTESSDESTEPTTAPAAPAVPLTSDDVAAQDSADDGASDNDTSTDDTSGSDSSTDTDTSATADAFDTPVTPSAVDSDDLVSIKQQALQDLTPLVDKLDQPAEEQFRTLMRMIQASDNPSLIKQAFDTAQKITDDKERAQALLDVINEINYFTTLKSNNN